MLVAVEEGQRCTAGCTVGHTAAVERIGVVEAGMREVRAGSTAVGAAGRMLLDTSVAVVVVVEEVVVVRGAG